MKKKIFSFLIILIIISIVPVVDAQLSLGEKASQKSVEVIIDFEGKVHVKHVIIPSNIPNQVDLIEGKVSNLLVTDEKGEEKQFSVIGDNIGLLILPSKSNSVIEYDLADALSQKEKVWTWDFRYLESTSFILPEEADLIFANERPIYLDQKRGITCHGCQMILEYSIDEPKIFEPIKWEDAEFVVEIISHSNIEKFTFDQPSKSITFDVSEKNRFVTTIIPLELLWGPYAVFLDDEKIFYHEYINNGTHVWINMKPDTTGEISIIGTTVVPEFPIIAPLAIGFLMIIVIPLLRKVNLR